LSSARSSAAIASSPVTGAGSRGNGGSVPAHGVCAHMRASITWKLARVIGAALYNQKRTAKLSNSKFSYLFHKKMLSPKELHMAVSEAAKLKEPVETYLMEKFGEAYESYIRTVRRWI